MLARLSQYCFHHRKRVLAIWLVVLVAAIVGGGALAGATATNGSLPGTDSQHAFDLLKASFPQRAGDDADLVFPDVTRNRPAIDAFVADVARVPGISAVDRLQVAANGHVAVVPVT